MTANTISRVSCALRPHRHAAAWLPAASLASADPQTVEHLVHRGMVDPDAVLGGYPVVQRVDRDVRAADPACTPMAASSAVSLRGASWRCAPGATRRAVVGATPQLGCA